MRFHPPQICEMMNFFGKEFRKKKKLKKPSRVNWKSVTLGNLQKKTVKILDLLVWWGGGKKWKIFSQMVVKNGDLLMVESKNNTLNKHKKWFSIYPTANYHRNRKIHLIQKSIFKTVNFPLLCSFTGGKTCLGSPFGVFFRNSTKGMVENRRENPYFRKGSTPKTVRKNPVV